MANGTGVSSGIEIDKFFTLVVKIKHMLTIYENQCGMSKRLVVILVKLYVLR